MADAAVVFLLTKLTEVADHHSHLIRDTSGHIERLQRDLRKFNLFLKDSAERRGKGDDEGTNMMVQDIREVVYEMEDIIDAFVNKSMQAKKSWFSLPRFLRSPLDLHYIGQQVEKVSEKVERARDEMKLVSLEDEPKSQQSHQDLLSLMKEDDVMGFEEEEENLIRRLKTDCEYLDVISLIGMFGLGKTTLALKVFNNPDIVEKFPVRIWLSISQEFTDRDIFLSILKEFPTITMDINSKKDKELVGLVIAHLQKRSFLIVMDDVWETAHWDRLSLALPVLHNNKGKVVITSRNEHVGKFASHPNPIVILELFDEEKSWKLLKSKALRTLACPPDLESVGRTIARKCGGLPLAIVIIAGILTTKFVRDNISATKKNWEKVSSSVTTHVEKKDEKMRVKKLISLSFGKLPYHMRPCFLYLGMFPEDYEIPASKLIRMWIGEGFIPHDNTCSLEDTAEDYLDELIQRNLVKSEKFKHDGKVKTCRVHDTLHSFCRAEAANEKLVTEIRCIDRTFSNPPPISDIDKYRHLSIHSNCLNFISSNFPSCPRVRSFVCFSKEEDLNAQHSSKIFAAFKFLKVLDVESFKFTKIDNDMYRLVYMRYMALSCNWSVLPSKFSQFYDIQTLRINTSSRTLQVKADIWKMSKLRYFKTNASAILPKPSRSSEHGNELQTLGTISVESCTTELFDRACKLKRLGIRGELSLLLEGKVGSFDSLGKRRHIEKLKLINDVYPFPCSERPLDGLPQHNQFPPGLTSLTLCATFLSWDAMSTLGFLKKLEVLKLKAQAFMGSTWQAVDEGFQCLELLHIEDTDLMIWKASRLHYPKLRSLVLRNCEKLLAIPIGMADIPTLQMLDLYNCKSAAASANAIKEAKKKTPSEGSPFVLSIFYLK